MFAGFLLAGCIEMGPDSGPSTSPPSSQVATTVPATTTTVPATTTTVPATTTTVPATTSTLAAITASGKVVGPEDQPIAGATVAIGDLTTVTGTDGLFGLMAPGPGPVTISAPGWATVEVDWDLATPFTTVEIKPRTVRGIRIGAGAAGDDAFFDRLLQLAETTSINAFVFDTKQEGGEILYETQVAAAHEIGAVDPGYDPRIRLEQVESAGLYAITRIAVFEDNYRVRARPEEKLAGAWLDPRSETAWDYNIDLAVEACELGFDEIQFDYVRFPAGRTATVSGQLSLSQEERVAAVAGFLERARETLRPLGCAVSADIFAIVVSMEDDQGLGQRPEELSSHVDALSPMVYPSHYAPGWLGFSDPNDHPYEVTRRAIDDALARLAPGAILRPWLQAFRWSNSQIRQAIQAAEDRGVGWILWNIGSNFDPAAIPTDDELVAPP